MRTLAHLHHFPQIEDFKPPNPASRRGSLDGGLCVAVPPPFGPALIHWTVLAAIVLFMECNAFAPMLVARLWQCVHSLQRPVRNVSLTLTLARRGLSGTILWTFGL